MERVININIAKEFFKLCTLVPTKTNIEDIQLGDKLFDLCFSLRRFIAKEKNLSNQLNSLSNEAEKIVMDIKAEAINENKLDYKEKDAHSIFKEFVEQMKINNEI